MLDCRLPLLVYLNLHSIPHLSSLPVSSLFNSAIVTVLDTDYSSFAALYECSNMKGIGILRRTKGTILSRNRTLDSETVEMVSYSTVQIYIFMLVLGYMLTCLYLSPSLFLFS